MRESFEIEGRIFYRVKPHSEKGEKIITELRRELPGRIRLFISGRDYYFDFDPALRKRELTVYDVERRMKFLVERFERKLLEEIRRGSYGIRVFREVNLPLSHFPKNPKPAFAVEGERIVKKTRFRDVEISLSLDRPENYGAVGMEYEISTREKEMIVPYLRLLEIFVRERVLPVAENVSQTYGIFYHFQPLTYPELFRRGKHVSNQ